MLEELEELGIVLCQDKDETEELVLHCYIALRLKPLKDTKFKDKIEDLANCILENYYTFEISIDYMINAIYNYINTENKCPSSKMLTDNINDFLETYNTLGV